MKYCWDDVSVEELAAWLCQMFSGDPPDQRPEIMPACRIFAEGLKTLAFDDSRTAPILTTLRRAVNNEDAEKLDSVLPKLIALLQ